jgi:uncharacterized protein YajQ (UPF0234 family)
VHQNLKAMFNILRSAKHTRSLVRKISLCNNVAANSTAVRFKSSYPVQDVVTFPSSTEPDHETPVLLNSKEHAVGYLSKILNARVYDAAIETQLQDAKSLSMVSGLILFGRAKNFQCIHSSNSASLVYLIC